MIAGFGLMEHLGGTLVTTSIIQSIYAPKSPEIYNFTYNASVSR